MVRPAARDRAAREASSVAGKLWWLTALGVAAALLFALATLPPQLFAGRLARFGVAAVEYSGSVWSGAATGLSWRGATLGDLRWRIAPGALLRGRLGAHVVLARPDGSVESDVVASLGGEVRLQAVRLDLPVEAVSVLPVGLPKGWRGRARADLAELRLRQGWPQSVRGTVDMDGLIAPPPRNTSIGSYHAVLPDPAAAAGATAGLTAKVTDKEGPFAVDARLTLAPDRSFLLDGTLAPRGDTPQALRRSLELLGPADATGRRQFSVSGTL